jgi:hypothetical protein
VLDFLFGNPLFFLRRMDHRVQLYYFRNYDSYLANQQRLFGEDWQTPTDILPRGATK